MSPRSEDLQEERGSEKSRADELVERSQRSF